MLARARHYATGEPIDVRCEDGVISSVSVPGDERPDVEAGWIAPAWFDIQINGARGTNFTNPRLTLEEVAGVAAVCRTHGIGLFCPTVVTGSFETLLHAFATLAAACAQDRRLGEALPWFHLEGPYISPEDGPRGAHPQEFVRPPDPDEFRLLQDAAEGRIGIVTFAPELPGAIAFIETLVASGVVAAIGHTAAS